MITRKEATNHLHRLKTTGFDKILAGSAQAHNIPVEFFYAVASRETNCINELGDFRNGEYHGVGIVQIDIQHTIAKEARNSGSWKINPKPLVEFGAQILAQNIQSARVEFPAFTENQILKIAASGYNCGMVNAIKGAHKGDSDKYTTGHNYGADVIARMGLFKQLALP